MVHPKHKAFGHSSGYGGGANYNRPGYAPNTQDQNSNEVAENVDRPILLTANTGFQVSANVADTNAAQAEPKLPPGVEKPGPRPAVPIESPEYRLWYEKWYAYSQATGDMSYEEVQTTTASPQVTSSSADSQGAFTNWNQPTQHFNVITSQASNLGAKHQAQNTGFSSSSTYSSAHTSSVDGKSHNKSHEGRKPPGKQFGDQLSSNWHGTHGSEVPEKQTPNTPSGGNKQAQYSHPPPNQRNHWENDTQARPAPQQISHHREVHGDQTFTSETGATPNDNSNFSNAEAYNKPEANYGSGNGQFSANANFVSTSQQPAKVESWARDSVTDSKNLTHTQFENTGRFESKNQFTQASNAPVPDTMRQSIAHPTQKLHEGQENMEYSYASNQSHVHPTSTSGFSVNYGQSMDAKYPPERSFVQSSFDSYHNSTNAPNNQNMDIDYSPVNKDSNEGGSYFKSESYGIEKSYAGSNVSRSTSIPPVYTSAVTTQENFQGPSNNTNLMPDTHMGHPIGNTGVEIRPKGPHESMRANFVSASNQPGKNFSSHVSKGMDSQAELAGTVNASKTNKLVQVSKSSNTMADAFRSMKDSSVMADFLGEGGVFDQAAMNRMIGAAMRNNPTVVQGLIGKMATGMMDPKELPSAVNQIMMAAVGKELSNPGMGVISGNNMGMMNQPMGDQTSGGLPMGNNNMIGQQPFNKQMVNNRMSSQSMFAGSSAVPNQSMIGNQPMDCNAFIGNQPVPSSLSKSIPPAAGFTQQPSIPVLWNEDQNKDAWQSQGPPVKRMKPDIPNPETIVSHSLGSSGGTLQISQLQFDENAVPERCNLLFMDQFRKAKKAGLDLSQMLVCCEVCDDVWGEKAHAVNDYVTHHITSTDHCKGMISWLDIHPNKRYQDMLTIPPHKPRSEAKKSASLKEKLKYAFFCEVCEVPAGYCKKVFLQHLKLPSHVNKLMALVKAIKPAGAISKKPVELKDVEYLLVPQRLPKLTRDKNRRKTFSCQICSVAANDVGELTFDNWIGHMSTQFHMSILYDWLARCKAPAAVPYQKVMSFKGHTAAEKKEPHYFCEICQKRIAHEDDQYQKHINSSKHKKNVKEMTDQMNHALSGGPVTKILEDENDGIGDVYHEDIDQQWSHPYAQAQEAKQLDKKQTLAIEQQRLAIEEQLKQSQNGMSGQQPQNMGFPHQRMQMQSMGQQGMMRPSLGSQQMAQGNLGQPVRPQQNMGMQGMSQQNMLIQGMPSNQGQLGIPSRNMAVQGILSSNTAMQGMPPQNMPMQGRPSQNIGMQSTPALQNTDMLSTSLQNMGQRRVDSQSIAMQGAPQNIGQQGLSPQKIMLQGVPSLIPGSQISQKLTPSVLPQQKMTQQGPFGQNMSQSALQAAGGVNLQSNANLQLNQMRNLGQAPFHDNSLQMMGDNLSLKDIRTSPTKGVMRQNMELKQMPNQDFTNRVIPTGSENRQNPEQFQAQNLGVLPFQKQMNDSLQNRQHMHPSDDKGAMIPKQNTRSQQNLNQVPVSTIRPQQNLSQVPVSTIRPQQNLSQVPVSTIRPQQNLSHAPVSTIRPQQNLSQAPVSSIRPQQNLNQVPVSTIRPQQNFSQVPVSTIRPQQNFSQVPVSTIRPQQNFSQVPVSTIRPQQNFSQVPVSTIRPQQNLSQVPVSTIRPQQNLSQVPVSTIRPQQNLGQAPSDHIGPRYNLGEQKTRGTASMQDGKFLDSINHASVKVVRPQQNTGQEPSRHVRPQQNLRQPPPNFRPRQDLTRPPPKIRPQHDTRQPPPNFRPRLNLREPPPNIRPQQSPMQPNVNRQPDVNQPPPNIRPRMNLPRHGPPLQLNAHNLPIRAPGSAGLKAPMRAPGSAGFRAPMRAPGLGLGAFPNRGPSPGNVTEMSNTPQNVKRQSGDLRQNPQENMIHPGKSDPNLRRTAPERHSLERNENLPPDQQQRFKTHPDRVSEQDFEKRGAQKFELPKHKPSLDAVNEWKQALDEFEEKVSKGLLGNRSLPNPHLQKSSNSEFQSIPSLMDLQLAPRNQVVADMDTFSPSTDAQSRSSRENVSIDPDLKANSSNLKRKFGESLSSSQIKRNILQEQRKLIEQAVLEQSANQTTSNSQALHIKPGLSSPGVGGKLVSVANNAKGGTKHADIVNTSTNSVKTNQGNSSTKEVHTANSSVEADSTVTSSASKALLPTPEKSALLPTPFAPGSTNRFTPSNKKPEGYTLFPDQVKEMAGLPCFPEKNAYCEICPEMPRFTDIVKWAEHISTIPHMRALFRFVSSRRGPLAHKLRDRISIPTRNLQNNYCICEVCEILSAQSAMELHLTSKKHVTSLKSLAVKMRDSGGWMKEYLANNKHEFWPKTDEDEPCSIEELEVPAEWVSRELRREIDRRNRAYKANLKFPSKKAEEKFRVLKKRVQKMVRREKDAHLIKLNAPNDVDDCEDDVKAGSSASTSDHSLSTANVPPQKFGNAGARPIRYDMSTGSSTSNLFDFQDDQMSFLHSVLTGVVALTTYKNMKQAGGDIPPSMEANINREQRIIVEKMCSTTGHLIISIARRVMEKQRKEKIMEFYPEVKPQLIDIITGLQPEILKLMAETPILDTPPP